MKKNLVYVLALCIAAGLTFWVLNKKEKPFAQADFSIKDTANISKIFLADMAGNTIKVVRDKKGWSLNDSMRANAIRVWNVIDVMMHAKPTQPLPDAMITMAVHGLSSGGIKVEVYDRDNKKIRSMIVGGALADNSGNYIKVDGLEKAYIYKIPNFDSDLLPNFDTDLDDWRSRTVLQIAPQDLKAVDIFYDQNIDSSFHIERNGNGYAITNGANKYTGDEKKCKKYFELFGRVNCVGFISNINNLDSVYQNGLRFGTLVTTTQANQKDSTILVYYQADQRAKSWKQIGNKYFDMEYLYGRNAEGSFVLKTSNFASILSTPSYLAKP